MRDLVVEDDPGIANFIPQGLAEAGFAVDLSQDGDDGLECALSTESDAIVLDIMLPGMDELEQLRELRSDSNAHADCQGCG